MSQSLFWSVAAGVEEDGAELESCIVGNAELPVRRERLLGITEVSLNDGELLTDLLFRGDVLPKPPVGPPVLQ
jgi:hypothetical protein